MTSPAQLKYLDAIGIPVWVSRDLVSDQKAIELESDNVRSSEVQNVTSQTSSTNPNEVSNNYNKTSVNNNPAQNILNSLNSPPDSPKFDIESGQAIVTLEKELHQSVDGAKIPTQLPSKISNVSQSSVSGSLNFLYQTSQHYIFAKGNENADWLVIGHSPEPFTGIGGEPFAGEPGVLLNNMLMAVDLENPYQESYIVNVLDVNQSAQLTDHSLTDLKQKLNSIIDKVKPKVIFLVGQIAAQTMLDCEDPLIIMRSKVHTIGESNIPCIVSYYPSYLLLKPIDKRKAWNDLKLAKSTVVDDS